MHARLSRPRVKLNPTSKSPHAESGLSHLLTRCEAPWKALLTPPNLVAMVPTLTLGYINEPARMRPAHVTIARGTEGKTGAEWRKGNLMKTRERKPRVLRWANRLFLTLWGIGVCGLDPFGQGNAQTPKSYLNKGTVHLPIQIDDGSDPPFKRCSFGSRKLPKLRGPSRKRCPAHRRCSLIGRRGTANTGSTS